MQTTLYFQEGASDKIYQAHMLEADDGFVVNFAYGRRGGTLKPGTKTKSPVARDKGLKIFDKLVKSKIAKGYTVEENAATFSSVDAEQSDIKCQLLNPIDAAEASRLCSDPRYMLQEKFDGERRPIEKNNKGIKGINRKGLYVGLSNVLVTELQNSKHDFILDSEDLGDKAAVFDILELDGQSLTHLSCVERLGILEGLGLDGVLKVVKTAYTETEKRAMMLEVDARKGEGVVFKEINAPYTAGCPSSGGSQLKHKFYDEATVVVSLINDNRRSVLVSVVSDDGQLQDVGNVTIPPNKNIPTVGQFVEVRYLYAYPNGGSLYQPTYKDVRTDKQNADKVSSLKFKPE